MVNDADEMFLRCCLEELRDGETVTIEGTLARSAYGWLEAHGATTEELSRLRLPANQAIRVGVRKSAKARLDADKTAKPKTRIVHHPPPGKLAGPGIPPVDPELEDVATGARTPLTRAARRHEVDLDALARDVETLRREQREAALSGHLAPALWHCQRADRLASAIAELRERREDAARPFVTRASDTCIYLRDGTKIIVRRQGTRAWLEHGPQAVLGTMPVKENG